MIEILKPTLTGRLDTCERCEYAGGFHVAPQPLDPDDPARRQVTMLLKCPNCGQLYDLGWQVSLAPDDNAE